MQGAADATKPIIDGDTEWNSSNDNKNIASLQSEITNLFKGLTGTISGYKYIRVGDTINDIPDSVDLYVKEAEGNTYNSSTTYYKISDNGDNYIEADEISNASTYNENKNNLY